MSIRHGWSWWRAAVSSRCERRSRAGAWSRRQPGPAPAPPARPRATATRPACSPAPPLVHPHIIHPHRLREDGRRIRTARPVPTHGYIENDEKRVVVHPPPRQVPRSDGLVQRVVDVPANRGRLPLDGVHVEGVGERARGQVIRAADAARTGVPGAVHRTVYAAGFLADVLHDVDLAARGPAGGGNVVAQQPERGPQPLPARDLNPGLDATVLPRAEPLGLEPGRCVVPVPERLAAGRDDEVASVDMRVLGAVGVELQFGVAPAPAPGLPDPLRGIEGGPVELVVPDELPHGGPGRGGGEGRTRGDGEPKQDAGHGDCFRYLQAPIPAPPLLIPQA